MAVLKSLAARLGGIALLLALAGCAGGPDRAAILSQLNPNPMAARTWARVRGTYAGPIRAVTERMGFEGQSSREMRLDLGGWVDSPEVTLNFDDGFSTAWVMYGEKRGTFSNIPSKRYGSQGVIDATTHWPNQLLLHMRRFGISNGAGAWMILTFLPSGNIDVETIGHSGWRGDGELWRVPASLRQL